MPNRQDLPSMSEVSSRSRMANAAASLGTAAMTRVVALALYLLGADLKQLAQFLDMRLDTVKALAKRAQRDGLPSLEDRRRGESSFLPRQRPPRPVSCSLLSNDDAFIVEFEGGRRIRLLRRHQAHCRVVLLTLLDAGLLDVGNVADTLGLSRERTRKLCAQLARSGVHAVLDKRKGQQQDYLFTPEVKSELVQQFALNAVSGRRTSGRAIAEDLQQRCEIEVSERTVRLHLDRLGLSRIANSLPELLEEQKKNFWRLLSSLDVASIKTSSPLMALKLVRRRAMVALFGAGVQTNSIASELQCSVQTVHRWVGRSNSTTELRDAPRSGRHLVYCEHTRVRITSFYCQTQPFAGFGRWSVRWAAQYLQQKPNELGVSPSKSTLHRILKNNRLKPHRSRYFLHITDPDFFPKMEHLVELFRQPPRRLFFFDECPGIQVLTRLVPDLQTETMKQRLEEFEYIRNGTLDVFAFLDNADGKVALECHAEHSTETLVNVFRRHVLKQPETEQLHYVMDNLNTHRSYRFCQVVAELSGVSCPAEQVLNRQAKRMQWLGRDDKRLVIHFTPFHGSWLNRIELWFGIMGAKVLRESFDGADELKAALEAFTDTWNQLFAHPLRWTYDGKLLHEKAVKRFIAMLRSHPSKLELRTLAKLLKLMTNLLRNYSSEVSEGTWQQLTTSLSSQSDAINTVIEQEDGPKRKLNARQAFDGLNEALQGRDPSTKQAA